MKNQFSLFAAPAPSIEGIDKRQALKSYSADVIGMTNKVRKPVSCNGDIWVNTGGCYSAGTYKGEMYRLVTPEDFDGPTYTYTSKLAIWRDGDKYPGDFARSDPNGSYHGMVVKSGTEMYVMCGPKLALDIGEADMNAIQDANRLEDMRADAAADDVDADELDFGNDDGIYDDEEDDGRTRIGNTPDDEDDDEEMAAAA